MTQRHDYERLPMYASPSSPTSRLRTNVQIHSFDTTLNVPPFSRSRSDSPKRTTGRPNRVCSLCRFLRLPIPHSRLSTTRLLANVLKYVLPLVAGLLLLLWWMYEPHVEIAFYARKWIQQEIEPVEPLAGCFEAGRVSEKYNISEYVYGKKRNEVQAGMPLKMGMDCYDFAGTIQSDTIHVGEREERTMYHTYWRVDLAAFGPRQEWMLKSYFATQDLARTKLVLWSNGDLSHNAILRRYRERYPDAFALEIVDIKELAKGTALEGSKLTDMKDTRAWLDGDLIRLLLLWNFGGVWVDMDSLLTRDLAPLFEHEFVTQWDCYDKPYSPFNGALMRFRQYSPYLCEAFHLMTTSSPPRPGSTDWGSLLYFKLWRRLVHAHIPPFKVLPFCFNDGRSCRLDNRLPDPFVPDPSDGKWTMGLGREEGGGLDKVLGMVFGVHLHNQWEKAFPSGGWVDRLLLRRYNNALHEASD